MLWNLFFSSIYSITRSLFWRIDFGEFEWSQDFYMHEIFILRTLKKAFRSLSSSRSHLTIQIGLEWGPSGRLTHSFKVEKKKLFIRLIVKKSEGRKKAYNLPTVAIMQLQRWPYCFKSQRIPPYNNNLRIMDIDLISN